MFLWLTNFDKSMCSQSDLKSLKNTNSRSITEKETYFHQDLNNDLNVPLNSRMRIVEQNRTRDECIDSGEFYDPVASNPPVSVKCHNTPNVHGRVSNTPSYVPLVSNTNVSYTNILFLNLIYYSAKVISFYL